eukprot:TRINITY_DN49972_c0_g1_i1.p1 TRINITY_DN49972_c0_g1~~TRINITY_DN49972_c0_g1_i1.p1  ORF type:complete len:256 (-),score=67.09 TRINITY_DN49972_c0_g1_i1:31-798(-)
MDHGFDMDQVDAWFAKQREETAKNLETRREDRTNLLSIGRWVTVDGLVSKPELNGRTGEVIQKEPSPGRVGILVHLESGSTKEFALKRSNLIPFSDEQTVTAVRLGAQKEGAALHCVETRVPRHLISGETVCPVPHAVGVPLLVAKAQPYLKLRERRDFDNQWATWLMIEQSNGGFAPAEWQSYVGPVLVYREDEQAFNSDDMLIVNDYLSCLLDEFGDGEVGEITAEAFQGFKVRQLKNYRMNPEYDQCLDINI